MRVEYGPVDQWVKGKMETRLNEFDFSDPDAPDPADVLKDARRQAICEWEEAGELQSLEDSALSNRDKRRNKFPKFKRRM